MFRAGLQKGFDKGRLRLLLVVFFLALAIPTLILVYQAYTQLKWEAFHQSRVLAEELAERIDSRLIDLIEAEEARSFADYAFLVLAGDPDANFLQRSPLSSYPVESAIPGLLGYFQVDTNGELSTPLLPEAGADARGYGISETEYALRLDLEQQIQSVLSENRLVARRPADPLARRLASTPAEEGEPRSRERDELAAVEMEGPAVDALVTPYMDNDEVPQQSAFDQLSQELNEAGREQVEKKQRANIMGRVADLKLDSSYEEKSSNLALPGVHSVAQSAPEPAPGKRATRKEQSTIPEPLAKAKGEAAAVADRPDIQPDIRISTFESEIDPFDFSLLDSGHFVLFRKVWRDGQRYIQGAVIEQQPFVKGLIESAYRDTAVSKISELIVAYNGDVLDVLSSQAGRDYLASSQELRGALLYQTRLSAPLGGLELVFGITQLPSGPGGSLLGWVTVILTIVLFGGFFGLYRLGAGQIELARQQQDFVSAVSHELKTPLTSIRMYGEMLQQGWANEEKKQTYYDYIYDESERLSRLISNVLQLARMTRNDPQFDLKPVKVGELMDMIRSKIASQVQRAGFALGTDCDEQAAATTIRVDTDCFAQIVINLVDNAIKFSAKADKKLIDITSRLQTDGTVLFTVRDFGPGVPKDQMKKIFKLFYRSESELTRETVGTGIGLALVHQLALAMDAKVDVRNREPGAEFGVSFPIISAS